MYRKFQSVEECYSRHGRLFQLGLLEPAEGEDYLEGYTRIDPNPVLHELMWKKQITRGFLAPGPGDRKPYQGKVSVDRLLAAISAKNTNATSSIFHFYGPMGFGKKRLARWLCEQKQPAHYGAATKRAYS